ncbi:succinate dehydrogenase cytochrome b subunit [Thalassoglobus sp. JC818]|uniref:succinate dehydrogenase cytochrome b subunit n=1 Tax=Thalassoglobus sp. JC818 TaxID=3232136 RepID=UPI0034584F3D
MSWLTGFLKSTVGRKFVMALTGLFLCFFLVVHLSGNLLLYVGGEAYDKYAHALHSNEEFLILAETLLFAAFALHIVLAFATTWENKSSRKTGYRKNESKRDDRALPLLLAPDYTMMVTGLVGMLFLVVHISDFKLEIGWGLEGMTPAQKAGLIVSDGTRLIIYMAGAIALGIHVSHGLASACQTIGFNHPKYTSGVEVISRIFGVVVALGFSSFPVMAQMYPEWFQFVGTVTTGH